MKTLFICNEFELDLTGKELNWTEENSWFHDDFILSSTFPAELDFNDNPYFLIFKNYNDYNPITKYDGILQQSNGKIQPAYLEIEEAQQRLKYTIRAGIEAFPTWTKKLSELPLGTVAPPEGMLAHALTVIDETWPAVNYNFPAVQCFDLYKDDPLFESAFHGYYNKMNVDGTAFIPNLENPEENTFANHNIVYPFVYWLHILHVGCNDAGYTLHGDILEDEDFKKALMPIRKIELEERPETVDWYVGEVDRTENTDFYSSDVELDANTRYRITGEFRPPNPLEFIWLIRLRYNGAVIYEVSFPQSHNQLSLNQYILPGSGGTLRMEVIYSKSNSMNMDDIFEGRIIPTHIYDEDGELIPALANFNHVDLAAQLPDMSWGELIKVLRAWKNYDFEVRDGKQIWMNLVDNEMVHENPFDLRDFEVKFPKRQFDQQGSYLLRFSEENEEYPFLMTFVNLDGIQTSVSEEDFPKDDHTREIIINAIPLPVLPMSHIGEGEGTLVTAKMITDDTSKPCLVLYDGLTAEGKNWCQPPDELMTPVVTEIYWFKFIMFMIRSVMFTWSLEGKLSDFAGLTKKSIIFAYNNYMVVKQLNRKQKGKTERIEIEARTF